MISIGLNLQNVKKWAKSEYSQVLVGFLIVFCIIGVISFLWNISYEISGIVIYSVTGGNVNPGPVTGPFDLAKGYIRNVIECETLAYSSIYSIMLFVKPFETFSVDSSGAEGWNLSSTVISSVVSLGDYVTKKLLWIIMFQYIIYNLLVFFEVSMLNLFLPAGLILRVFPISRGLGGFLIALAIGCFFVFPMSYVILVAIQGSADEFCTSIGNVEIYDRRICPDDIAGYNLIARDVGQNLPSWTSLIFHIGENVSILYLQSTFFPVVALIITFTFIRSTSALFSADLAELGRGLIKLI
ncbi:MAG: hypothetical protein QXW70_01540 [Candidatus Anstonellales archaeon]